MPSVQVEKNWSSYPLQQMQLGPREVLWRLLIYEIWRECDRSQPESQMDLPRLSGNLQLLSLPALKRMAIGLGFNFVAHFLIQTRRSQPNSEDSGAKSFISAEISLPSAGTKSQPSSCNESLYAAEDHEDEIEEEKRKCSFLDSKYVDMDGGWKKDYDNDDTIDNNVGLKEKEVDMDEQEVISSEL